MLSFQGGSAFSDESEFLTLSAERKMPWRSGDEVTQKRWAAGLFKESPALKRELEARAYLLTELRSKNDELRDERLIRSLFESVAGGFDIPEIEVADRTKRDAYQKSFTDLFQNVDKTLRIHKDSKVGYPDVLWEVMGERNLLVEKGDARTESDNERLLAIDKYFQNIIGDVPSVGMDPFASLRETLGKNPKEKFESEAFVKNELTIKLLEKELRALVAKYKQLLTDPKQNKSDFTSLKDRIIHFCYNELHTGYNKTTQSRVSYLNTIGKKIGKNEDIGNALLNYAVDQIKQSDPSVIHITSKNIFDEEGNHNQLLHIKSTQLLQEDLTQKFYDVIIEKFTKAQTETFNEFKNLLNDKIDARSNFERVHTRLDLIMAMAEQYLSGAPLNHGDNIPELGNKPQKDFFDEIMQAYVTAFKPSEDSHYDYQDSANRGPRHTEAFQRALSYHLQQYKSKEINDVEKIDISKFPNLLPVKQTLQAAVTEIFDTCDDILWKRERFVRGANDLSEKRPLNITDAKGELDRCRKKYAGENIDEGIFLEVKTESNATYKKAQEKQKEAFLNQLKDKKTQTTEFLSREDWDKVNSDEKQRDQLIETFHQHILNPALYESNEKLKEHVKERYTKARDTLRQNEKEAFNATSEAMKNMERKHQTHLKSGDPVALLAVVSEDDKLSKYSDGKDAAGYDLDEHTLYALTNDPKYVEDSTVISLRQQLGLTAVEDSFIREALIHHMKNQGSPGFLARLQISLGQRETQLEKAVESQKEILTKKPEQHIKDVKTQLESSKRQSRQHLKALETKLELYGGKKEEDLETFTRNYKQRNQEKKSQSVEQISEFAEYRHINVIKVYYQKAYYAYIRALEINDSLKGIAKKEFPTFEEWCKHPKDEAKNLHDFKNVFNDAPESLFADEIPIDEDLEKYQQRDEWLKIARKYQRMIFWSYFQEEAKTLKELDATNNLQIITQAYAEKLSLYEKQRNQCRNLIEVLMKKMKYDSPYVFLDLKEYEDAMIFEGQLGSRVPANEIYRTSPAAEELTALAKKDPELQALLDAEEYSEIDYRHKIEELLLFNHALDKLTMDYRRCKETTSKLLVEKQSIDDTLSHEDDNIEEVKSAFENKARSEKAYEKAIIEDEKVRDAQEKYTKFSPQLTKAQTQIQHCQSLPSQQRQSVSNTVDAFIHQRSEQVKSLMCDGKPKRALANAYYQSKKATSGIEGSFGLSETEKSVPGYRPNLSEDDAVKNNIPKVISSNRRGNAVFAGPEAERVTWTDKKMKAPSIFIEKGSRKALMIPIVSKESPDSITNRVSRNVDLFIQRGGLKENKLDVSGILNGSAEGIRLAMHIYLYTKAHYGREYSVTGFKKGILHSIPDPKIRASLLREYDEADVKYQATANEALQEKSTEVYDSMASGQHTVDEARMLEEEYLSQFRFGATSAA